MLFVQLLLMTILAYFIDEIKERSEAVMSAEAPFLLPFKGDLSRSFRFFVFDF